MINVAILDDHKMVVKSLKKLIDESNIAKVTQVYFDIQSCRAELGKALPDILLLDIGLPDGNGVDFCAELLNTFPRLKIIMLTTYKEFNVSKRSLQNGALGYILKNSEPEDIISGIEMVNKGERYLCKETTVLLKKRVYEEAVWFSPRELEILKYIADGYTTSEIAHRIHRNIETVRTYRKILLFKFEAENMAQMIKKAYQQNLVQ